MTEAEAEAEAPARGSALARAEDALGLLLVGGMVALPIVDLLLRRFDASIPGGLRVVQVLTLWVGMSGALLATRRNEHLALTAGVSFLSGRLRRAAELLSTHLAVSVTAALSIGAFVTVWAERLSTETVALGVPSWIPQLVLPIGYGAMALRLAWVRAPSWRWALVLVVAAAGTLAGLNGLGWEAREAWIWPLVLLVVLSAGLGTPIYVVLGGTALLLFWSEEIPIAAVAVETLRQLEDDTLPVLPLFTFTGYVLAESRASARLVEAFRGLFGWLPGGMAVMTALVCAFFTTFTGASGVTILALGGLLYPVLRADGYPERFGVGLLTASGSIGLLFPPALPVIIYGVVAGVPIDRLFVAGVLPGAVLVGAVALLGVRTAMVTPGIARTPFHARSALGGVWTAKWELAVPVVAMGSYFSGLASLLEAAALTTLYAVLVATLVHRDLRLRQLVGVARDSTALVGGVLVIFGVAMGLTNYLNDAMVPSMVLEWVEATVESKWVFLAALNVFLLVVGCFMDIFSALVVVVPLILPVGAHFGVDPIHLGIIFLANLELGFLTPPVGMNLFLSAYRFDRPLPEIYRTVVPFLLVLLVAVLLVTYVPALTLAPVEWLFPPAADAPAPIQF